MAFGTVQQRHPLPFFLSDSYAVMLTMIFRRGDEAGRVHEHGRLPLPPAGAGPGKRQRIQPQDQVRDRGYNLRYTSIL